MIKMKQKYILLTLFGFSVVTLMITNPSIIEHKEKIKKEIIYSDEQLIGNMQLKKNIIFKKGDSSISITLDEVDGMLDIDNYVILSIGKLKNGSQFQLPVTVGILGQIFLVNKKEIKERDNISITSVTDNITTQANLEPSEINELQGINVSAVISEELISKKITKINFKDIDNKIKFKEIKLKNGGRISYHLEKDVEEDTHALSFYLNNSSIVYNCFIQSSDYSLNSNFYFTVSNWVIDQDENCKNIFYSINLEFYDGIPTFVIKKTHEGICA